MSDFLSLFTYRNLLIVEAAALVLVLALTLRKPEVITTKSGNTVERPRSRTGLICTLLLLAVTWALHMTGFQLSVIFQKGKNIVAILEKLFRPKWDFFPKVITPLVDTIKMSILGTVIGCAAALPIAVLASSNIDHNKFIVSLLRVILGLIRTLPTLVIALVCALIFSLGTFAGTVSIAIFTFGIVAKMLYESIETIDMGPFEAMEALGADKFQAFWSACVPQILPVYACTALK